MVKIRLNLVVTVPEEASVIQVKELLEELKGKVETITSSSSIAEDGLGWKIEGLPFEM